MSSQRILAALLPILCGGSACAPPAPDTPAMPRVLRSPRTERELPFAYEGLTRAAGSPSGLLYVTGKQHLLGVERDGSNRWSLEIPGHDTVSLAVCSGDRSVVLLSRTADGPWLTRVAEHGKIVARRPLGRPLDAATVDCNHAGDIAIAGWEPGADSEPSQELVVLRLDDALVERWARGGTTVPEETDAARVAIAEDGAVAVITARATRGTNIAWFDAAGTVSCRTALEGSTWVRATRRGTDGGLVLGGNFRGDIDLGPGHRGRALDSGGSAFVMTIDPTCRTRWAWTTRASDESATIWLEPGAGVVHAVMQVRTAPPEHWLSPRTHAVQTLDLATGAPRGSRRWRVPSVYAFIDRL